MQQIYIQNFFKDKKGFKKLLNYSHIINHPHFQTIEERAKIIKFFDTFGASATRAAFGKARSTVYLWKQKLKAHGGNILSLAPKSKAPKTTKKPTYPWKIVEFIKKFRQEHPRIGKEKIKPFLDVFCKENGIKTISASTIGRIIKKNNYFFQPTKVSHFGKVSPKRRKKNRIGRYVPEKPGDLIQIDAVERIVEGLRRYVITAIDLRSKFSFALCYNRLNSVNARDFLKRFQEVSPFKIKRIQTDNGSEFEKFFDRYLRDQGIEHFYTHARRWQENSVIERFNRTLQEEFIDWYEDYMLETYEFNRKLIEWLMWYNDKRPHQSLGYKTPLDYICETNSQSNMLWTYTSI